MYTITYRFWWVTAKPTEKSFTDLESAEYWYNYYLNSLNACCVTKSW